MKNQASHTTSARTSSLRLLPEIALVDLADPSLSERLAGKVSDQMEAFAARMREGLLAASGGDRLGRDGRAGRRRGH
jgi:hypothetical protein